MSCAVETEAAKCGEKLRDDLAFSACFTPLVNGVLQREPVPTFFCGK